MTKATKLNQSKYVSWHYVIASAQQLAGITQNQRSNANCKHTVDFFNFVIFLFLCCIHYQSESRC